MSPLDERDLINLNAYLDDELSPAERAAFEKRLAAEPVLRQELDVLSTTVNVLKLAERLRAPRNFTLDPAVYGKPASRNLMDWLGLLGLPQLVAVGGTLVAAMICAAAIIFSTQGLGGAAAPSAAELYMEEESAAQTLPESADVAMDAAEAEETEAPETAAIAANATDEPEEAAFEPLESPEPDFDGGGQGGGAGGAGGGTEPVVGEPLTPSATPNAALMPNPAGETDTQRNAGTDVAQPPSEGDDAQADESMDTFIGDAQPTDEAGKQPEVLEPPSIPIIPIAIAVLVLALGSGVLIARLARRR